MPHNKKEQNYNLKHNGSLIMVIEAAIKNVDRLLAEKRKREAEAKERKEAEEKKK